MKEEDRTNAVEMLRRVAEWVEVHPEATLKGTLKATRVLPLSRREIDAWVRSGCIYMNPMERDRTQTTTLTFDLR